MSLPVILDPDAEAEFDDAFDFYEGRGAGLGESFAQAAIAVLRGIGATPRMHAVVVSGVRKAVVRNFPFCVYYVEESTQVRVISVFHTSRDPKLWQSRT